MTALDSASLKYWESVADWGTVFVIIGVAGEGVEILVKFFEPCLKRTQKWRHFFHKADPWINMIGGLFWIMVVLGLWAEFKGNHLAKVILDKENVELHARAANLETNAAALNLKAEGLRSDNLKLEKQLLETVTNVANLDRGKWPVHSITAEVRLRFAPKPELMGNLSFPARLTISPSQPMNAYKRADPRADPGVALLSSTAIFLPNQNSSAAPKSVVLPPLYLMQFLSSFRPLAIGISPRLMPGKTAEQASRDLEVVSLEITNFPPVNAEVVWGQTSVTINEKFVTRFQLVPGKIENGCGILKGRVNTNSPPIILDIK